MKRFARAEIVSRGRMVAALCGGSFLLLMVVALAYTAIGRGSLQSLFHGKSQKAITALSGSPNGNPFSPHGWMAFGFNHPLFLTLTLTIAIAVGSGAIAGEVERGRAELLFSAPVARARFLWSALLVWLVAELAVLFTATAGAVVGAAFSSDLRAAGLLALLWAPAQYLPLALFIAASAFLASALSATQGKATGAAVGVAVIGYLLSVVSGLISWLDWLRWLTPFGYYDPGAAISHGIQWLDALALTAASALLLGLARLALERRDLA